MSVEKSLLASNKNVNRRAIYYSILAPRLIFMGLSFTFPFHCPVTAADYVRVHQRLSTCHLMSALWPQRVRSDVVGNRSQAGFMST